MWSYLSFPPFIFSICHEAFLKFLSYVFWIPFICSCTQCCIQTLFSVLQSLQMLVHFSKNKSTCYRMRFASPVILNNAISSSNWNLQNSSSARAAGSGPSIISCEVRGHTRNKVSLLEDWSLDRPGWFHFRIIFSVFCKRCLELKSICSLCFKCLQRHCLHNKYRLLPVGCSTNNNEEKKKSYKKRLQCGCPKTDSCFNWNIYCHSGKVITRTKAEV